MDIEDVRRLVAGNEGSNVEFKETTGQLERGMETLCAFLNGEGGTVLFGVTDKGKIVGQEVTDSTKRAIAEAINRLDPRAAVVVSYIPMGDTMKQVIALSVEDARYERPFSYKGRAYMRIESVTSTMPQSSFADMLLQREGSRHGWDSYSSKDLTINDLDEKELAKTIRLGIECGRLPETTDNDAETLLAKLGLYENKCLKNAAAVLFANKTLADYPQITLRMARFRGSDKSIFIDNQRVYGNIFQLLDAAMAFVFKHLSLSATTETLEREERLAIPYKAIRESVVNALCHRDYRDYRGSVSIAIYDDRVEIVNPGALPFGWTIDRLKQSHESKPQNPLIASVLYMRKVVENWGRGINLVMDECKKANMPEPTYEIESGDIKLTFIFASQNATPQVPPKCPLNQNESNNQDISSINDGRKKQTPQVPPKYPPSTPQVKKLIFAIGVNTYSQKEILDILNLRDRKNFRKNYLQPAIEGGWVEATVSNQPNSSKQKYRLTEISKQMLSAEYD